MKRLIQFEPISITIFYNFQYDFYDYIVDNFPQTHVNLKGGVQLIPILSEVFLF